MLSFNLSTDQLRQLSALLPGRYGLHVVPHFEGQQSLPTFLLSTVLAQVEQKMAIGDAMQALYIDRFSPHARSLLSWNARHFQQKLAIPVLAPEEWLTQHGL